MIMDGRLVGTIRREPPSVIGDGNRTIRELVEEQNKGRMLPGVESISRLASIALDDVVVEYLARQGLSPEVVLTAGKKVTLRGNANLVTGGSCADVSADLHPEIKTAAEALARTLDVDLAGFDYITTDISRPWWEVPGSFIELNQAPALDVLTLAGLEPVEVGKPVLGMQLGRIPIELLIAADDQVAAVEAYLTELTVAQEFGWASHDHARLGKLPLSVHGSHPWSGVLSLLSHKLLERAIIVVASRHMQISGLPVDRADHIWICDGHLPNEWLAVLGRVSRSAPWIGSWDECRSILKESIAPVHSRPSPSGA